jgi:hypothetical protein
VDRNHLLAKISSLLVRFLNTTLRVFGKVRTYGSRAAEFVVDAAFDAMVNGFLAFEGEMEGDLGCCDQLVCAL